MLFLGCDSGATKVDFVLAREDGVVLARKSFPGVTMVTDGLDDYSAEMRRYLRALLSAAGAKAEDVTCATFGLTGYGESKTSVADMQAVFAGVLGDSPLILVNDSVTGWSGALRCRPGICLCSGTGSVAYGEDEHRNGARAGGWSIRYGDEGSAHWVAAEAFRAFFHQADGRMPRTLLYDYFMELFDASDPLHICGEIEAFTDAGDYAKVARFQRSVLELYKRGDPCARDIYRAAARELCALAKALKDRLDFAPDKPISVTYTGGLFRAGECVLAPLAEYVQAMGGALVAPAYGPLAGAAGYAARAYVSGDVLETLMARVEQSTSD